MYNYCSAQLVSTEGVDFETTPSLTVTVIAMDDNFHRLQEEFTVEVLDQNDPPTVRLASRAARAALCSVGQCTSPSCTCRYCNSYLWGH